jgi:hypothetical protein
LTTSRRALLVVGMHRSGTSALTGVLGLCGAALPPDLLPANEGNEAGYWEGQALVSMHDRWLDELGTSWDGPTWASRQAQLLSQRSRFAAELRVVLEQEFGDAALIVVKDPRLCLLLPVWFEALDDAGIESLTLLCYRHPLESAQSLHARDGMPIGAALLLWLQYTLAAELSSRDRPRLMVAFTELLTDSRAVIDRVQRAFSLTLPAYTAATAAAIDSFLRPQLRHARAEGSDAALPQWVSDVNAWFAAARDGRLPADTTPLDSVRRSVLDAEALFAPAWDWHRAQDHEQHAAQVSEVDYWKTYAGGREAAVAVLQSQGDESRRVIDAMARERDAARDVLAKAGAEGSHLLAQSTDASARIQQLERHVRALEQSWPFRAQALLRRVTPSRRGHHR